MNINEIKENLGNLKDEFNIELFDVIDSTNTYAKKEAVNGAPDKTVIIAEKQTNGRGRMGRDFYSPSQNGIYMSVVLKDLNDTTLLTVATATAVSKAIEKISGVKTYIKWVNDIFVDNKKVCGILAEAVNNSKTGKAEAVVLGIGINVKSTNDFPCELKEIAGALNEKIEIRSKLIAEVLKEINIFLQNDLKNTLPYYKEKSMVLNNFITYELKGRIFKGKVIDINENGNLIVENEDKNIVIIHSGEIRLNVNDISLK